MNVVNMSRTDAVAVSRAYWMVDRLHWQTEIRVLAAMPVDLKFDHVPVVAVFPKNDAGLMLARRIVKDHNRVLRSEEQRVHKQNRV